jgi:hypothetical protein
MPVISAHIISQSEQLGKLYQDTANEELTTAQFGAILFKQLGYFEIAICYLLHRIKSVVKILPANILIRIKDKIKFPKGGDHV